MKTTARSNCGVDFRIGRRANEISRERLFFWIFLAASANSVTGAAIRMVLEQGSGYSLFNLFGISAIVWLGFVAALVLLAEKSGTLANQVDYAAGALASLLIVVPVSSASSVAITILGMYVIITSDAGSNLRRAGVIFVSISISLFWGRLILALFSRSFLHVDAFFITKLFGARQVGNEVAFIDKSFGSFVVAPGCSSLQGMSLAFVFWATLTQWYRVSFSIKSASWCAAALVATLAINVMRLGAIAYFPQYFDAIHTGWGWHLASWTTLAAIVAICVYGARNEIFEGR